MTSRGAHGIALVGPVLTDNSWQARSPEGHEIACCAIDWTAHTVTYPQGKVNRRWTPGQDYQGGGQEVIAIHFDPADCAACPVRARCTQAAIGPRTRKLRPQAQHDAPQTARRYQQTATFRVIPTKVSSVVMRFVSQFDPVFGTLP